MLDTAELRMTDSEFRMFSELLERHCGLHFGPESRFVLEKRLARRLRELELTSFAAYQILVRSEGQSGGELSQLIDDVTTNETYFFRERNQLRALVEEILPEARTRRAKSGGGPISIWSAGCASGEEPYSIVMLALEAGFDPSRELRVYASDISRRMLQRARKGSYREASFRETESHLRRRYFSEKDGLWQIADEVKQHVNFTHLNLMDRSKIGLLGMMDVVLCRNVIIYFKGETKRTVIETFHEKLRPGGHLLLGHAESLINLSTSFQLRHLRNDMVYQRPLVSIPDLDPWRAATRPPLRRDGEETG